MPTPIAPLLASVLAALFSVSATAADPEQTHETAATPTTTESGSSKQIEKDLQNLNWEQFKSVVKAVPKLKADVDAFGPLGWQYVQLNYQTYGWKKNIDKLDHMQKKQLVGLIAKAKGGAGS